MPARHSQTTTVNESRPASRATPVIRKSGGFRETLSFGLVCLVCYATELFCRRNFDLKNDPLGKAFGQMLGAARSAKQNIVEGSSRAGTSRETELRLYDVAKGSLEELAGDYEDFLITRGELPWSEHDPQATQARDLQFDAFTARDDLRHKFATHLLTMRQRFAPALENDDPVVAANAILVTIDRACALLRRQMDALGEDYRERGGFTEHLSKVRMERREKVADDDAPTCPQCGGPMRKILAKKGQTPATRSGVARLGRSATAPGNGNGSESEGDYQGITASLGDKRQATRDKRKGRFDLTTCVLAPLRSPLCRPFSPPTPNPGAGRG